MFNLFVGILTGISVLDGIFSVESSPSGTPKNGNGCHEVLTAPSGNILSPNYGPKSSYPNNVACTWTVRAPQGKTINLQFSDFVIEKSPSCKSDYLLLFDGETNAARLVGRYCSVKPAPFTSSSNYIHLEFYSDVALGYRGFFATYNTLVPTTEKPTQWTSSPKFKSTVLNKTAIVGDSIKLLCEVDGTPEPAITWRKDSRNLTRDKNIIIRNGSFKSEVTIIKVGKRDQGRYSCKASNGVGTTIAAHGSLVVQDRKIPIITNETKKQVVSVGEKLELFCQAEGLAPMKISLIEKNKELRSSKCNKARQCQVQHTKLFVDDSVITCKVSNTAGNDTKNIHITVKGPPVIIQAPQNQTVEHAGVVVNFSCKAIGKDLRMSWLKDNEHISDYGNVTRSVHSFSVKKNTTVTCKVEGKHGATLKNARVLIVKTPEKKKKPPKRIKPKFFKVQKKLQRVNYKDSPSISCRATGYLLPHFSWKLNDSNVSYTTKEIPRKGLSTITLHSLEKTVTVTCFVKSENETINSTATIAVTGTEPAVLPKQSGTMNDNIKLILGAGGGVLVLTGLIILFIVVRRKRNKKIEKKDARPSSAESAAREDEHLITNPIFSITDKVVDAKPGVDMLHYPWDCIEHTETLANGSHIEMFLGCAVDLPFSPGEYSVVVRALKNEDPSEEMKDDFDREASLLANLVHPNVVRLMAVCIKTTPLCLVFEYSSHGYLDEYLRDCDSSKVNRAVAKKAPVVRDSFAELAIVDRLSIAKQIASGMKYLADKGYVHQELRARNCLVFKDLQVKVANLGLHWAKPDQNFFVMEPDEKERFPVRWLPAEVILYGEYTHSSDVWSYGVVAWEIFSNAQMPYTGIHDNDVASYVRGGNILPRPKICPHEVYEVMKSCWEMAPLQRPDFKSLQETMSALHAGVPV